MNLLAIGDVCGPVGCDTVYKKLHGLKNELSVDVVIINAENSAVGNGTTPQTAQFLLNCGADILTGGNHSLRHMDFHLFLDENPNVLRPHNFTDCTVGAGYGFYDFGRFCVAVINISGTVYLDKPSCSNPFLCAQDLIDRAVSDKADYIFVDFHAEATSEKIAMGYFLDGRASAVFGTHTHVQTADAKILENGTGYITDLGMTGPRDSVLGVQKNIIIDRFCGKSQEKFQFAAGDGMLNGCLFAFDDSTKKLVSVKPINI